MYCSKPDCQRKRKARWQKQKLATDPAYKEDQHLANNKWLENNRDYWEKYRSRNPGKAERNRLLQKVRNMKKRETHASKPPKSESIAKMDARKVFIACVPGNFP